MISETKFIGLTQTYTAVKWQNEAQADYSEWLGWVSNYIKIMVRWVTLDIF